MQIVQPIYVNLLHESRTKNRIVAMEWFTILPQDFFLKSAVSASYPIIILGSLLLTQPVRSRRAAGVQERD